MQLFEPLKIKNVTLRNRVVMPPMVGNMGVVTGQAIAFYRERAKGGVGTVIVEATPVERFENKAFADGLARLADAIHQEGAVIAIQLFQRNVIEGERTGVSEVTPEGIQTIKERFVNAATVAQKAGFDGVEPHGAHGYFLNQFFSPRTNQRTDEFGGSLAGRMQTGLQIVKSIRRAIGEEMLIFYRHTPEQGGNGYTLEDTLKFVVELEKATVDVIDISPSMRSGGAHAGLAAAVKSKVSVPVIAVGGMNDPVVAEEALNDSKCDLIAIGRGLIADPFWAKKVREEMEAEITECVECNEKCFGNLSKGTPISCTQNTDAGHEYERNR